METDRASRLLDLPAEVHGLISRELPLSSHLLYRTQVCSALRTLFGGHLHLPHSHRFDLVEWRRAQREVREILARQDSDDSESQEKQDNTWTREAKRRSIWDISPTSTPRPAPSISAAPSSVLYPESARFQAAQQSHQRKKGEVMLVHRDHPDVSLFVHCLQFLGKMSAGVSDKNPLVRLRSDKITVLSLLSRGGFKVASLIQLLETQPSLYHVETIFMTSASFVDAILWTVFTPHQAKRRSSLLPRSSPHIDLEYSQSTCIDTAAIVIPGPLSEKGQGLRSGFKCLCFSSPVKTSSEAKQTNISNDIPPFHVIFHDYYTEEEAIGTQDMLENSDISCNSCKRKIRF